MAEPQDQQIKNKEKDNEASPRTARSSARGSQKTQNKEYFKVELNRLKTSLDMEVSKIQKPKVKEHTPYVFNNLEPYYNMYLASYLVDMPEEVRHGYSRRETAIGLCDPWKALEMDAKPLPKIESKAVQPKDEQKLRKKDGERPPKEGSTHLPKFPAVQIPAGDLKTKNLDFSKVRSLRRDIARKYSANADSRVNDEYLRTKNDIYRMELDKLEDIHEVNRQHMRRTYFAYLQNNKGAKKAVYECFPKQQTQKETVKQN